MKIGIAGAGPAGLASALFLHKAGHSVSVFDQFATPQPLGSGLILQPPGQFVLAQLGLHSKVAALGQTITRLEGRDALSGRLVLDVKYSGWSKAHFGIGVHRGALFQTLLDAVLAQGIHVQSGVKVAAVHKNADGQKIIKNEDGDAIGVFDLVIDSLGSFSPLRGLSHGQGRMRALDFGALWATLDECPGMDVTALSQRYRHAETMVGVLPVGRVSPTGKRQSAFFWSLKNTDYEALRQRGLAAWKEDVRRVWPETEGYLTQIPDWGQLSHARYAQYTMRHPYGDGIAFVGDSAHSTSPQLGQGANMALLDAFALSLALQHTPNLKAALKAYARCRRTHIALYQRLSYWFTPFYQSDSKALAFMRDFLVAGPARLAPAQWLLGKLVCGLLVAPIGRIGLAPKVDFEKI